MLITNAALGHPPCPACRSFTAATISSQAHTSQTRGLQGMSTTSATLIASAFTRVMPGGQSMIIQRYSPAVALTWRTSAPASTPCTVRCESGWGSTEDQPTALRWGSQSRRSTAGSSLPRTDARLVAKHVFPTPTLLVHYGDYRHGCCPPASHQRTYAPLYPCTISTYHQCLHHLRQQV